MDWHRKNSWTGYSFDNSLFPDEQAFMAAMHGNSCCSHNLTLPPPPTMQAFMAAMHAEGLLLA